MNYLYKIIISLIAGFTIFSTPCLEVKQFAQEFNDKEFLLEIKKWIPENPVIVDCGAYSGNEIKLMVEIWPLATIHAFEAVPEIFNSLQSNMQSYKNVFCYQIALSDTIGSARFHVSEWPAGVPFQSGSLLAPKEHVNLCESIFPRTISVNTITLDQWAQENNIKKIDCLWLDMQGYELFMMKASPEIMKNVKAIYTEVEFVEAYAGQPQFNEMKTWLENQGFTFIARDFPIEKRTQWFGNMLFVRV
jgi:2-O-methyltransferase